MSNDELKTQIKIAISDLYQAKANLNQAKDILEKSIIVNDNAFKNSTFSSLETDINNQMYILNVKIVNKLN